MKKYMLSDTNQTTSNNFLMRYAEIQIMNYDLFYCNSTTQLKIHFPNGNPVCTSLTARSYLSEVKKTKLHLFNVSAFERASLQYGSLDLLFFQDQQLTDPSVIAINSQTGVTNLNNLLKSADRLRDATYHTSQETQGNNITADYYSELYESQIDILADSYTNSYNFSLDSINNNVDLFDLHTNKAKITVYFSDLSNKMLGLVSFFYNVIEGAIDTKSSSYTLAIQSVDITEVIYQLLRVACTGGLFLAFFLKVRELGHFWHAMNRSAFLLFFLAALSFEYVFRGYHMVKGTNDYFDSNHLIQDLYRREVAVFFDGNVRIIRGFEIIFLCFHLVYVMFNIKDLIAFTIFFKPVFQRSLIVIAIFILALAVIFNQFLGSYYYEFNYMEVSFFNILNYAMGVTSVSITNESSYSSKTKLQRLYFNLFNFVLRLVTLNFSLVIIFYFYRKSRRNNDSGKHK